MKVLRITADGLPLFKEKLDICFYAQQRVSEDQKDNLYSLFSNIYLDPTVESLQFDEKDQKMVICFYHQE